jgi:hypothetical protein
LVTTSYPSTAIETIPAMAAAGKSDGWATAGRALRRLERGATTLRIQIVRSVQERRPPPPVQQPVARPDVSEVEVRDLRAELASELERLAGADIGASRGPGKLAGERPSADGHA